MTTGDLGKAAPHPRRLRLALIVAVVVAVVLGTVSVLFFVDLLGISPCNGGIGLGVTSCPAEPGFQAEQLGHNQFVNGSYVCSFIVYPITPGPTLYSTSLLVWGQSLSGARVSLSSITLYSATGSTLTNYSFSGTNWTADKTVEIFEPVLLTATSSTNLAGQVLVISDTVTHVTGYMNIH